MSPTSPGAPGRVPAGQRPPPPPWGRAAAGALLLLALALLLARGPLLRWADTQPVPALPRPGRPATPAAPPWAVAAGLGAQLARAALHPPGLRLVQGAATLGLAVLALELGHAAARLVIHARLTRRPGVICLSVQVPQPTAGAASTAAGPDLLRALHRQLPHHGAALGRAPWLSLTLHARPDAPVALGLVIGGGTAAQRAALAATVSRTVQGLAPAALVAPVADPLAAATTPGAAVGWACWRLARAPHHPLRRADDGDGDLLGPLLAALAPPPGVRAVELQLTLQPRRADVALTRGWRAAGLRRLLALQRRQAHALAPDARALDAKLQAVAYAATLRAVAVADAGGRPDGALGAVHAALGQYAARTGSTLQRWVRAGHGQLRVPTCAAWQVGWPGTLLSLAAGLAGTLLCHPLTAPLGAHAPHLAGRFPLLTLPAPLTAALPSALTTLLPPLAGLLLTASVQRRCGHLALARLARLHTRAPRAAPPGGPLGTRAWRGPAILGPDELAGLWHLPTPALGRLVRWLPCRYLPPPPHAFVPEAAPPAPPPWRDRLRAWWRRLLGQAAPAQPPAAPDGPPARLVVGIGRHRDGRAAPVGLPLRDARQGLACTAPPGVGKTQLASNLADQLRPCGFTLLDGKGDDAGNLVAVVRRRIPLADEARLVLLDVLDAAWPVGLNPLAGLDLADAAQVDQALGQLEGVFARLDPETWGKAPRMRTYLRKAALLVLAGEPQPTLAHVKQALLDGSYRARLLPHCRNVEVTDFWAVEFPQIGEQQRASRDALVSRFDMLLDSELTRFLFNQAQPTLRFDAAIAARLIVLVPLPHRALGALAGPVGMLLFGALLRGAFARPGDDRTRAEYGLIADEFQVLVEHGDTKDVRDALTQVRAFGIVTVIANQLHRQLGDLADYALTAISNRIVLRTQEPDATLYARHYAASGITAADVSGQPPRDHQYAWLSVDGQLTGLCSIRPLPWLPDLDVTVPPDAGPPWQTVRPPASPTPQFDAAICALVYSDHADPQALAQALAQADDAHWAQLHTRWAAVRDHQRQHILAHPGCIPDRTERQRWLSRLAAARPRVLALAEYARIRQAVAPDAAAGGRARGRPTAAASPALAEPVDRAARATQQPHFAELDQAAPPRLARVEPDDWTVARPAAGVDDGA